MKFCGYYQAAVVRERCWLLTALLRSYEHLAFDRTCDVRTSTFEFFVPEAHDEVFRAVMRRFEQDGLVTGVIKLPNRYASGTVASAETAPPTSPIR